MIREELSNLINEVLRLNDLLLVTCDSLLSNFGLSSARLRVLGALTAFPAGRPVVHLARDLNITRQAVQRLVDEMERDGFLRFQPNPHHQRAKLVLFTHKGRVLYKEALTRLQPLSRKLVKGLSGKEIDSACGVLKGLRQRLEAEIGTGSARAKMGA